MPRLATFSIAVDYAVYVTNISEDGVLIQGNNLWVPKEGTRAIR